MTTLLDNLAGLLATVAFVSLVAWIVDRLDERREWTRETDTWHGADVTEPEPDDEDEDEYRPRHAWDDETVVGCATQLRRRAGLHEPTEEFRVLLSSVWSTGEREALSDALAYPWRAEPAHTEQVDAPDEATLETVLDGLRRWDIGQPGMELAR